MAWNRSVDKEKVGRPRSGTPYRGLLAGLIVVLGGGLAAWMMMRGERVEKVEKVEKKPSQIAEVAPHIVPQADPTLTRKPLKERVELANSRLSESAKDSLERIDAIIRERQADTSGVVQLAVPLLKNPTDQLYFGIFSIPLGDMPPMTPFLNEKDEMQAVIDIGVELKEEETDTPRQKDAKALVNDVKKLLDDFIREGGTINEFFDHYCYEIQKAFEFRNEAQRLLNKSVEEGDKEAALELEKALNKELDARGIRNVRLTENDLSELDSESDGDASLQ